MPRIYKPRYKEGVEVPKVKCADCGFYEFYEDIGLEPRGGCTNDNVLDDVCMLDYNGRNWRLNQRNSNTLRYCDSFTLRKKA